MTGRETSIFRGSARPVSRWRGDLVVQQTPCAFWLTQWQAFIEIFPLICLVTPQLHWAAPKRSHSLPSESPQKEWQIQVCWKSIVLLSCKPGHIIIIIIDWHLSSPFLFSKTKEPAETRTKENTGKRREYVKQEQFGKGQKWKRKSNSSLIQGKKSFLRNVNKSGNPGTYSSSDLAKHTSPFPVCELLFVNEIQIRLFIEPCQSHSFQVSFCLWHSLNLKIIIIKKHMHVINSPYSNGNTMLS